jgi:hypothetical protein
MSIAAHTITDLLSVKEARSSSTARTEPYDIHAMGRDLNLLLRSRPSSGRAFDLPGESGTTTPTCDSDCTKRSRKH